MRKFPVLHKPAGEVRYGTTVRDETVEIVNGRPKIVSYNLTSLGEVYLLLEGISTRFEIMMNRKNPEFYRRHGLTEGMHFESKSPARMISY